MPSPMSEKDDLDHRIAAAQAKQAAKHAPKKSASVAGYGLGMKMVLDLVGGALVGLIFGLAVDEWLGTKPWGLFILLTLGMVAGFRLMLRTAHQQAMRSQQEQNDGLKSSTVDRD